MRLPKDLQAIADHLVEALSTASKPAIWRKKVEGALTAAAEAEREHLADQLASLVADLEYFTAPYDFPDRIRSFEDSLRTGSRAPEFKARRPAGPKGRGRR